MDDAIRYRLRMNEVIPPEMSSYRIGRRTEAVGGTSSRERHVAGGRVHFTVPKLFTASLCLLGAHHEDGWLEVVGKKNKAAITRSVGHPFHVHSCGSHWSAFAFFSQTKATDSPITRIFGGKFRSTLRAPHQRDSVTVEDWRALRLDIQVF